MIIICPNSECKANLDIKQEMFGNVVRCPNCDKTIQLKIYKTNTKSKNTPTDPEIIRRKIIAFYKAILDNNTKSVTSLLNFSPKLVLTKDAKGRLPIHIAASKGSVEMLELLLSKNADIDSLDIERKTPMHYAAEAGFLEAIKFLLAKGANGNLKDKRLKTPKDIANMNGHEEIIDFLSSHS